jgi:acetyl-CoA acetyltransferase
MQALSDSNVAIAANHELPPGRYPDQSAVDLTRRVTRELITENDLQPEDIDGLYVAPPGLAGGKDVEFFAHELIYDELGIQPSVAGTINAGGATYGVMLHQALLAVVTGQAESVLCLGAGKFAKPEEGGAQHAKNATHDAFEYPYGPFIPAMYGIVASRYLHEYGATREDLSHVSVASREWALQNPDALMYDQGPLTAEEVLESGIVAEPLSRLHCSVPTDGGGAFLVTTGERARTITDRPAYIHGIGETHTHGYLSQAPSFTTMGGKKSSQRAYEMASLSPDDVDVAEIYDAFVCNPLMYLEDLGLAEDGEAPELFRSGECSPGGSMPVNTNGGLHSYGHTGDSSGMSMMNEGITQARGQAGNRQVEEAETVLVHTYGGMMCDHSTVLFGRNPR